MIVASPCAEKWEVKPMFVGHAPLAWFRISREVAPVVGPEIAPKPAKKPRKGAAKDAFIRSQEWKDTREVIFARDGRVCKHCRSTSNLQIDHIKPMAYAPELKLVHTNLQVLCWPCNKRKGTKHTALTNLATLSGC